MDITLLGIDISKNVFHLYGVDTKGNRVLKQQVKRSKLLEVIGKLPLCTIAMEACGASNYWGLINITL